MAKDKPTQFADGLFPKKRTAAQLSAAEQKRMDLPYTLVRSRRKSIALSIDSMGSVKINAPMSVSADRIAQFIAAKYDWAVAKRQQALGRLDKLKPLFSAQSILIDGNFYRIHFATTRSQQSIYGDTAKLFCGSDFNGADNVKILSAAAKFIKKVASEVLVKRTAALIEQFGFDRVQNIIISDFRTSWGICNSLGHIKLNYRLAMLPPALCEYVIMHELCHTLHMDHSPKFWKKMSVLMPDFRIHKKDLTDYSPLLQLYRS